MVHGRWDEIGWDEMIVLHVARARTDSINIRRSLGKTLALRSGLPLLLSFIFPMQCLPLPTHLYPWLSHLVGKERRRLVILYVPFSPALLIFQFVDWINRTLANDLSRWKIVVWLVVNLGVKLDYQLFRIIGSVWFLLWIFKYFLDVFDAVENFKPDFFFFFL